MKNRFVIKALLSGQGLVETRHDFSDINESPARLKDFICDPSHWVRGDIQPAKDRLEQAVIYDRETDQIVYTMRGGWKGKFAKKFVTALYDAGLQIAVFTKFQTDMEEMICVIVEATVQAVELWIDKGNLGSLNYLEKVNQVHVYNVFEGKAVTKF